MKIGIVGSINVDVMYEVDRAPKQGETIFGNKYNIKNGGKGANQAVILNSLEDDVVFFGAVGTDIFGLQARNNLITKGLKSQVESKDGNTGLAIIQLSNGDNEIIVFKGANDKINEEDIDMFFKKNPDLDIIVSQLEINLESIKYLIDKAYNLGIKVILNPAPAVSLNPDIVNKVTYLIPNETEAEAIFKTNDLEQIVKENKGKVIITIGKQGVMYLDGILPRILPSEKITVVDTTGAGDSFVAGFTSGIAQGLEVKEAIEKGIRVASITCQYLGAQTSYTKVKEVFNK
ncbi:MAG: ribokinase [Tenericutes bacterium]|nr:ribokinase [Mycoplasmatota bacterium]